MKKSHNSISSFIKAQLGNTRSEFTYVDSNGILFDIGLAVDEIGVGDIEIQAKIFDLNRKSKGGGRKLMKRKSTGIGTLKRVSSYAKRRSLSRAKESKPAFLSQLKNADSDFLNFLEESQLELYYECFLKIECFEQNQDRNLAEQIVSIVTKDDESFLHFRNFRKENASYDLDNITEDMFSDDRKLLINVMKKFHFFHAGGQNVQSLPSLKSRIESPMKNDLWSSVEVNIPSFIKQTLEDVRELDGVINLAIINNGYHIEFGTVDAPKMPELTISFPEWTELFYTTSLFSLDHTNYIGTTEDDDPGTIIVSVQRKKGNQRFLKCLLRSQEDFVRFWLDCNYENFQDTITTLFPQLKNVKFNQVRKKTLKNSLLELESSQLKQYVNFKFGVLYVGPGQVTEDEIYGNFEGSENYNEFLEFLGDRIELSGYTGYTGGLSTHESAKTGRYSIITKQKGHDIMFHVGTLLPHNDKDDQQLEKKRHIGNDIVIIIFKEGDQPFDPREFHSHFQHAYIIVERLSNVKTKYKITVVTKPGVKQSLPTLPYPAILGSKAYDREFFLTKCINIERAATNDVLKFQEIAKRDRKNFIEATARPYIKTTKEKN